MCGFSLSHPSPFSLTFWSPSSLFTYHCLTASLTHLLIHSLSHWLTDQVVCYSTYRVTLDSKIGSDSRPMLYRRIRSIVEPVTNRTCLWFLNHGNPKYSVFINYFFFQKNLIYSGLWPFSVFPRCQCMCTHARQVEHQRCSRTGRVQKKYNILRKKYNI